MVLGGGSGSWSSSNTSVATVNATTGVVTAVGAGTCNIIYTVTGGCSGTKTSQASYTVHANPIAGSISATPIGDICAGTSAGLTLTGNSGTIQWQTNASGSWVNISGATTSSYTTPVLTSTTSYRAVVSNGVCADVNASHTVNVTLPNITGLTSNDYVWTGATNTNWNNTTNTNWLIYLGSVFSVPSSTPGAGSNVFIRQTASCFTSIPIVSTVSIAECNNLTIDAGNSLNLNTGGELVINGSLSNKGTLNMASSGTSNINIKGAWNSENGSFNAGTGTVSFNGTGNLQAIKTGGSPFNNVVFDNSGGFNLTDAVKINGEATFTDGIIGFMGSGTLTFGSTATSNHGTTTSFVNGSVTKQGSSAFVFPVGDGTVWAPIGIAAPSSASNITAQYFFEQPDYNYHNWSIGYMCPGTERLHHSSGVEYWELTSSTQGVYPAVTLYWKDGTRSDIGSIPDLRVAHWNESCWANMGGVVTGTLSSGSITSTIPFTSYSPITLGTTTKNNPLPVELVNLTANCNDGIVKLEWTTATEINNDHFELERSRDGLTWIKFAEIEGAGNSNIAINYEYNDVHPGSGDIYYRLLQVDYDGTSEYSDIIHTNCVEPLSLPVISVYPNPFRDIFTLQIDNWDMNELEFEVCDMLGQSLLVRKFQNVTNNITTNINLRDIAPSMYILKIKTSDGVVIKKIEKK